MPASPTNSSEYREAIAKLTAEIASLDEERTKIEAKREKAEDELAKLHAARKLKIEAEIEAAKQAAVQAATQAKLEEWGVALADLSPSEPGKSKAAPAKKAKSKPPAKYRYDTGETWSGRGRKPKWAQEAKANGTLENYLIKPLAT